MDIKFLRNLLVGVVVATVMQFLFLYLHACWDVDFGGIFFVPLGITVAITVFAALTIATRR